MGRLTFKASLLAIVLVLFAIPAVAQEGPDIVGRDPGGFISALGGGARLAGNETASLLLEGGVRIAPHVMVFGNFGKLDDLPAGIQPALDATVASASSQGAMVTGSGSLSAWKGIVGLRLEAPVGSALFPYLLGGAGAARLSPVEHFAFAGGAMPDGSLPNVGDEVTSSLAALGVYAPLKSATAGMWMVGGGVQVPLASRIVIDGSYRYSRIAANSAIMSPVLNINTFRIGIGYRF